MQTNPVITRNCVTPAPITPTIINQVHYIYDREGIYSCNKISNRTGLLSYDSSWIVGVYYSEDGDNENEFENESGNQEDDDTESSDVPTDDKDIIENVDPNEVRDIL